MHTALISEFPGLAALEIIYEDYARDCTNCTLSKNRKRVVFGVGSSTADLAIVGSEPSIMDDAATEPFWQSTTSGHLIDAVLNKLDRTRQTSYLCHAVCCVPKPGYRVTKAQYEACQPILLAQMRAVRPKVIVALGLAAGAALTGVQEPGLGLWYNLSNGRAKANIAIPVLVSYSIQAVLDEKDEPKRRRAHDEMWQHLGSVAEKLKTVRSDLF
jgi:DNA polymerase